MREFWLKINSSLNSREKEGLIKKHSQLFNTIIVDPEDIKLARKICTTIIASTSKEADIFLTDCIEDVFKAKKSNIKTVFDVTIKTKEDIQKIMTAIEAKTDYVIAKCPDWKIIPLENLIASINNKSKLLAFVSNSLDAKIALETLEIGVDGIVTDSKKTEEIIKIYEVSKEVRTRISEVESIKKILLEHAEITNMKPLSSGARVCIDTCDLMKEGEGLLVGCQSSGLFLVEAEIHDTPFVNPRPFRVNAGSIALYVLVGDQKTRYLSELKAGDDVMIVDREGRTRLTSVCRIKIEWRPMLLIEAESELGGLVKVILQNAETIRVISEKESKSVCELASGDHVTVRLEKGGRHFGTLVKEEKVIEK
jgi:3-dehydroquinate synthase II